MGPSGNNNTVIESPLVGHAVHRIILDDEGIPCDYEYLAVNDTFEKITGLKRDELIGNTIKNVVPDVEKSKFDWISCFGEVALTGIQKELEQYVENLDRWYKIHVYSTEKYYFSVLFIDTTEFKQKSTDLEEFFSVNLDLLCIADLKGNFLKVNQEWTSLLGYKKSDLEGKSFLSFIHPDDVEKTLQAMQQLDKMQDVTNFTNRYRCKDGNYRFIEWRSHPKDNLIYAAARDITDRINVEKALIREKELFAVGPVVSIEWDPATEFLVRTVSSNVENILGYSEKEMMVPDFRFFELIHPDDKDYILQEIREKAKSSADRYEQSYRLKRKSGDYRWFYAFTMLDRDAQNNPIGIRGYLYDQTVQKQAELELSAQKKRLSGIIKGTRVGTWEWNVQTGKTSFNEHWANMIGYSLEELVPTSIETWMRFAHPEDLKKSESLLKKHFNGDLDYYEFESRMKHRNGEWIWVLDRGQVASWTPDGKPLTMLGTHQDITKRKRMESELLERENELQHSLAQVEVFQTLVESSGDCFYMVDLDDDGKMVYVNKASIDHFGASKEEILQWKIPDWDPNFDDSNLPALIEKIITHKRLHLETQHRLADGSIVPVEISVNLRIDSTGRKFCYGWFTNIENRQKAERELLAAKQQAESANKAKSEFLANMSHEIRTPLNAVIGFTELLKNTPLNALQQDYIENAIVSGHALMGIINDILDFSKIEAGMLHLEKVTTNMVELMEDSIDIIRYQSESKHLELLLNIDPSMPLYAKVDPVRLKQVVSNLLSNAVKFTEKGEVELKLNYHPIDEHNGRFYVAVRDTGIGITEEQKSRLFKAFSQADNSTTRKFGGTGLGLIISDMIVRKMGNHIQIESVPNEGSTFYFDFETEIEEVKKQPLSTSIEGLKRCLIIDDNSNNRSILKGLLNQWGIHAESCSDGSSAIQMLDQPGAFDLVICDLHMPGANGLEVIREIRETLGIPATELPIILLHSSSDSPILQETCDQLEVGFRLTKPIKSTELYKYLSNLKDADWHFSGNLRSQSNTPTPTLRSDSPIHILISEDVEMNMILVKAMISKICPDATIHEAKNGKEALQACQKHDFDLILSDVQMPEMDGIQFTQHMRKSELESNKHTPIIALTAGAFKDEQDRCLNAGMDDILHKPIHQQKLYKILSDFIKSTPEQPKAIHFERQKLIEEFDETFADEIAQQLKKHVPSSIITLETDLKNNNADHFVAELHSLKGVCLTGALPKLAALALEMEMQARDGIEIDKIAEKLPDLKSAWEKAEAELS